MIRNALITCELKQGWKRDLPCAWSWLMSLTETDVNKTLPKAILKELGHTGSFVIRRISSETKNSNIYIYML